jgi:hypothetical protein
MKISAERAICYVVKRGLVCAAQDSYLVGKMDKDHYVDVSVIAEFKLIKQLTTDVDLIIASVKGSEQIVIDEAKKRIKPASLNQRTTLILRNIPSDAATDAVEKLLGTLKLPKVLSLRAEIGDNWFATFENEDATKSALELVKGLKWQDKRISAAIKSENALKGLNVGGSSSIGVVAPFYVPMGVASNGSYIVSNGQYNYSYGAGGEGGHPGYRQGGRGVGGRRVPGSSGAVGGNGTVVDGGENARRAAGKKKGRGVREGTGREAGGDNSRLPGSSLPSGNKEGTQASINLADFPILEAKGTKKDGEAPAKPETAKSASASTDVQKKENIAPSTSADTIVTGSDAAPVASKSVSEPSVSASSAPKKSYAQMALANAAAASAAPSGPAVPPAPTAPAVAAKPAE